MKARCMLVVVAALALAGCGSAAPTVSGAEVSSSKAAAMASIKGAIEQQLGTTTQAPVCFLARTHRSPRRCSLRSAPSTPG